MNISMDLSPSSIKKAIKDIRKYQKQLDAKCNLFCKKLAQEGVLLAQNNIRAYGAVYSGELLASLKAENGDLIKHGARWYVRTYSPEAPFVEFGVGPKGAADPDEFLPPGVSWNYDEGSTIFETKDGRRGWFFPADDGKWYFTQGAGSRPFMYSSARELEQTVVEIAREVFKS